MSVATKPTADASMSHSYFFKFEEEEASLRGRQIKLALHLPLYQNLTACTLIMMQFMYECLAVRPKVTE